jgi:hypothetical protein
MPSIRAMIIPADHISRTDTGKWNVNGIYNYACTITDEIILLPRLYIRMQFERIGVFPCRLSIADRSKAPHLPPGFAVDFSATVTADNRNVAETMIELPLLRVPAPVPASERAPGSAVKVGFLFDLVVDGESVASLDFDTIFIGPPAQANIP